MFEFAILVVFFLKFDKSTVFLFDIKLYKPEVCSAELSFFLAFSQQSTALVM